MTRRDSGLTCGVVVCSVGGASAWGRRSNWLGVAMGLYRFHVSNVGVGEQLFAFYWPASYQPLAYVSENVRRDWGY